jgi:hypothetical protein
MFLMSDHSGSWCAILKQVDVLSSGFIALALLLISFCLIAVWRERRRDMKRGWVLVIFAAFGAACGLTHIRDIAVSSAPAPPFFTVMSAVAAILAVAAAMRLPRLTELALNFLTPERFRQTTLELEDAIKLKDRAIEDLSTTVAALRRQVDHLERMRKAGLWVAEQEAALRALTTALGSSSASEAST